MNEWIEDRAGAREKMAIVCSANENKNGSISMPSRNHFSVRVRRRCRFILMKRDSFCREFGFFSRSFSMNKLNSDWNSGQWTANIFHDNENELFSNFHSVSFHIFCLINTIVVSPSHFSTPGTSVEQVNATDYDTGINARIRWVQTQ